MAGVLQGFAIILGVIAVGYIAAVAGVVRGSERLVLNRLAFFVATPALLFGVVLRSDPRVLVSPVILVTTASAIGAAALFVAVSRVWFRQDFAATTLGATTAGYVNSNNLGLPVAIYILGDAAYMAPLILVQVLFFAPLVLGVLEFTANAAQRGQQAHRGRALSGALRGVGRAVRSPIIVASALGLACSLLRLPVPDVVLAPLDMVGGAAIPLILLSFGASLRGERPLRRDHPRRPTLVASAIKTFAMPALAWLACWAINLPPHETFVALTISALPTAQNVYNYAANYGQAELQVRDTILITTFASLPVIALIAWGFAG